MNTIEQKKKKDEQIFPFHVFVNNFIFQKKKLKCPDCGSLGGLLAQMKKH